MDPHRDGEQSFIDALAHAYYEVVDAQYRTACTLTASVSCAVLRHFGYEAQTVPCQLWYSRPQRNYILGFVGNTPTPGKWDGHLVCISGRYLLDASLYHFHKEFSLDVPWVAAVPRVPVPSQILARHELPGGHALKWLHPPPASDTHYPEVPQTLVQTLAQRLIARLT